MSKKSAGIAAMIEPHQGKALDAHYLGYFDCFNRQLFFEAHDVLEELWLADRSHPNHYFYKGLIQLAGAFVHLQKSRLKPSAALFHLAETNLGRYPAFHECLDVSAVLRMIQKWVRELEEGNFERNPLTQTHTPKLELISNTN